MCILGLRNLGNHAGLAKFCGHFARRLVGVSPQSGTKKKAYALHCNPESGHVDFRALSSDGDGLYLKTG